MKITVTPEVALDILMLAHRRIAAGSEDPCWRHVIREINGCEVWGCDGDHKYYSHNSATGELVGWDEA